MKAKKARVKHPVVEYMRYSRVSSRIHRLCREFVGESWLEHVPRLSPMLEPASGIQTDNLMGYLELTHGDHIVKKSNGEFRIYDPDTFKAVYDVVEEE